MNIDDIDYNQKAIVESCMCPICWEIMDEATNLCSNGYQLHIYIIVLNY